MENGGSDADRFSRTIEELVRRLREKTQSDPLSSAAASTLRRLHEDGPSGVTQLARSEGVSQPAMTQLVDRLAQDKLVERKIPTGDRRSVVVHLTPAGLDVLDERRTRRANRLDSYVRSLSSDDQDAIAAIVPALERLTQVVIAADPHPTPTAKKEEPIR